MIRVLVSILGLTLLTGCAPLRPSVSIGRGGSYQLTHPEQFGISGVAIQHVRFQGLGKTFQFDAFTEVESDRTVIVGMTPFGSRGFALEWDGIRLTYEKLPFYKLPLAPNELMADYQFIFLPAEQLSQALARGGMRLHQTDGKRRIERNGRPILMIDYPQPDPFSGEVVLTHQRRGYTLVIQTKSMDRTPQSGE